VTCKKLYESRDASINISVEPRFTRLLLGFAYTEAPFTTQVRMRMIALHLLWFCFTFTRFSIHEATQAEIQAEARRRGRDLRVPKKQPKRRA